MQVWQAFLLVCILSGFGVTAYQLHKTNRFSQIDDELDRRLAALNKDYRNLFPMPAGPRQGRPRFDPDMELFLKKRPDLGPMDLDGPGGLGGRGGHGGGKGGGPGGRGGGMDGMGPGGHGPGGPEMRMKEFFEPREIRLSTQTLNLFDQTDTNSFYFCFWSNNGNALKRSTNAPANIVLPKIQNTEKKVDRTYGDQIYRENYYFTGMGDCILVGISIVSDLRAIQRYAGWLFIAGGAVLALGLGGGWWVAHRAIHPIETISATASRISEGSLSERINLADTDSELGRLASVLNSTFGRLEAAFEQQKQFTADASHELRTPIAIIISEAQTTLARERSADEYRETIKGCLETAQQMRRLTRSLLELARYDAGQQDFDKNPVDLEELAKACIDLVTPLAQEKKVQINASLCPSSVDGDVDRLGQVITNLLNNAIYYNRPDGTVHVNLKKERDSAVISISDTGKGIAPEDLPHIYKRFYRSDKARARSDGHYGLGLAICKAIVNLHGGSIEASSQMNVGSTFTVRLPLIQHRAVEQEKSS